MKQQQNKYEFKTKLREGDEVVILTGRSKGESGKIENIDKKKGRVYIAGKNLGKRHQKPDLRNNEGGIIEVAMPIHISNVALVDPKNSKPSRIGYKVEDNQKVRVAKKSKAVISK